MSFNTKIQKNITILIIMKGFMENIKFTVYIAITAVNATQVENYLIRIFFQSCVYISIPTSVPSEMMF